MENAACFLQVIQIFKPKSVLGNFCPKQQLVCGQKILRIFAQAKACATATAF
jgi:hypothetical protein